MKNLSAKVVFTLNVLASYFCATYVYDYFDLAELGENWLTAIGIIAFCLSYCVINFSMYLLMRNRITENTPVVNLHLKLTHYLHRILTHPNSQIMALS